MRDVLVVGLGSEYSGDDSIGFRLAELLKAKLPATIRVEIAEDPSKLSDLLSGEERALVLIDAMLSGNLAPGEHVALNLKELEGSDVPLRSASSHSLDLIGWLRLLRATAALPEQVLIVAVEVEQLASDGLSERLERALPQIADRVREEILRRLGLHVDT